MPFRTLTQAGFTVYKELGRGSQGVAKLAKDPTGREFCVKCLKKDTMSAAGIEELQEEFQTLQLLAHDNIAQVFEIFQDAQFYYMVGEPYHGGDFMTLTQRAKEQQVPMTEDWWRGIFRQCAEALEFMHEQSMMHCDIKEPNIMIKSRDFRHPEVVVIDFGVCRAMVTAPNGMPGGTPGYMPPETIQQRKWLPRGDVFCLGVTFIQAASSWKVARRSRRAHIREEMRKGMREKLEKVRAELEGDDPEAPAKTEDVEMDGSRICGQMTMSCNHALFLVLCLLCWAPVGGDCLPEAVLEKNRTYIQDIDGNDIPIGFLRMDWRSSVIATAIARILVEEVLGYHTTAEADPALRSRYAFLALAGCQNYNDAPTPISSGNLKPPSTGGSRKSRSWTLNLSQSSFRNTAQRSGTTISCAQRPKELMSTRPRATTSALKQSLSPS
ncbi:cmk-1 [Symbiodinium sp. CCMP2456]|nr:cmk-1 [Symbiodinium sp. CCMP2456]